MPEPWPSAAGVSPVKQALLAKRLRAIAQHPVIGRRPAGQLPPLSSGQERLWVFEQFAPGTTAYSIAIGSRLTGSLDVALLRRAWHEVIGRHEALRMRFPAGPDVGPMVVIDESVSTELRRYDLAAAQLDREETEQRAASIAAGVAAERFDLAAGPLIRQALIRLADDDHALIIVMHHIIADGWSIEIFMREILGAYGALCQGRTPALPELPVQFGDYATWERQRLSGPAVQPDLGYWEAQLSDLPPLDLTMAKQRPPEQRFHGGLHEFDLGLELTEAVAGLSRRYGVTIYMTLMAAFQALLARHAGQCDFAVGSPIAGRPHRELEGVVGPFVNMMTVRARLADDPSFLQILSRCRDTVLDGMSHQDVPFDHIVNHLKVKRDPGRSALFQVTFTLDNLATAAGGTAQAPPGLDIREFRVDTPVTHFDLTLHAAEGADGLSCCFAYRTDLFEAADIERLAAHMKVMLGTAVDRPDLRLSQLPILTATERESVVTRWAHPLADQGPEPGTLHAMIEAQAFRTPQAAALVMDGRSLTHGELDRRANRLARLLRGLGVGADVRVAICLPQSLELAVAVLSVLKAGGAYLPMDPEQPMERLEYVLADAQAAVLVTDSTHWAGRASGCDVINLDQEAAALAAQSDEPLPPASGPGDLAYVIYTSGTTGTPKGVAVEHGSVVRYLQSVREVLGIEPGCAYALLQSLSFDFSILMFYLPLLSGGRLHLLQRRIAGEDLAHAISRLGIDYIKMTPSHLAALTTDIDPARLLPRRGLVLAGEAVPAEFARTIAAEGRCAVFNSYGPTEAVVAVTTHKVTAAGCERTASAPIGRPMRGVRAMVLDNRLTPVPPGVAGELYLGGNRLARGYLRHPALTAQRFVADPFGRPGSRLYRTGDLVRWLDEGVLEFLGRTDHQVKIRGYRVELQEIEAALARLPEVSQALADLRGTAGREHLVAYLDTTADSDALSDHDIRAAVAGWLPEYMIPARFIRLNGFPRQAHGKIDRKALPEPDSEASAAKSGQVAPRNRTERAIADVWMQILELAEVGIHDNFFELGGNSLLATRVVARLRKSLGNTVAPVGVMDIFKYPTVAELAVFMTRTGDPSSPRLLYELTPPVRDDERALSFVCAPYGGANASVYAELAAALPAGNSLYAIQVPGRDLGLPAEQLPIDRLAEKCVKEILQSIQGPLVIYGHCGPGGALAVAVAQQLDAAGRQVEALYLGGIFPMAQPTGRLLKPLTRLIEMDRLRSDRNHANWLRGMGSDISDLDADQVRVMVRAMREDGRLAEAYFTELFSGGGQKLQAPVISVVGERDPSSAFYQERYTEWAFLSDSLAVVLLREAGHFFVRHRAAELAEIVTLTHRAMLTGRAADLSRSQLGAGATWWLHDCTTMTGTPAPDDLRTVPDGTIAITEAGDHAGPGPTTTVGPAPGMRRFLAVALGQLVSITGSTLTEFAFPLWVYLNTGSLARFGLLAVAGLVPGVVAAPLAGAVVDRYNRRRVMIAGDLAAGTAEALLLVLAWTSTLQLWQVYVVAGFLSVALAFQRTAYMSAIPQIVPKRYLGHANGIVQATTGFAQFIAPLMGVGLLAVVGLRGILSFDVVSYAIAVGVVLLVRFPATMAVRRTESILAEIGEGLRFTLTQPSFRAMIILFAALSLALAPLFILVSPLVLSFSSLSSVAEMAIAAGVGAAVAGLVMTVWGGPQIRRMLGIRVMTLALAVSAVLLGLRPNLILIGVGVFGVGFCVGTINGIIMTIIQTKVPQRLQGRVIALNTMIAATAVPFGFGVVAPYGPRLLAPLTTATGTTGTIVRAIIGTGPGRGIGLLDIACALVIALLALWAGRFRKLARFDVDVRDALPDDLVGIEAMGQVAATTVRTVQGPSPDKR